MEQRIIIAGFGGQGVLSIGQMLAYAAMLNEQEVTWLPSYGPEMRGGTVNCNVIISDKPIAYPMVNHADAVLVMNNPSLIKFAPAVVPGGCLFVNSSLVTSTCDRTDIEIFNIPCNEMAEELGNSRMANMIMLGAYLKKSSVVPTDLVLESLLKVLGENKRPLLPLNEKALAAGAALVK